MKKILGLLICLATLHALAQDTTSAFDPHKWQPPYSLGMPAGWDVERFTIPISFAPQIHYKGIEDIRFTPGWGKVNTEEYWSYSFLWFLDGKQTMSAKIIGDNLKAYYTGLVGMNIESRKIPVEKQVSVKTAFTTVTRYKGDLQTFNGTVDMLDYMEQKPMTLHAIVHVRACAGQDKTFVFTEISPKEYAHAVWQSMNQLWEDFNCTTGEKKK